MAAERGGADRIELCADLSVGGLTPGRELLCSVREKVCIPVFSMVRPLAGNFAYSAAEFEQMKSGVAHAKESGGRCDQQMEGASCRTARRKSYHG